MTPDSTQPTDLQSTPRTDAKRLYWNLSKREQLEAFFERTGLGVNGEGINGKVVLATDMEKIERELNAAKAEVEKLKEAIRNIKPEADCPFCKPATPCSHCMEMARLSGTLQHLLK